jgi:hypothetical protein
LGRGIHCEDGEGVMVEREVQAEGPANGERIEGGRRGDYADVGNVGRGTKDDKDATRKAGARSMKKLCTRPNCARS